MDGTGPDAGASFRDAVAQSVREQYEAEFDRLDAEVDAVARWTCRAGEDADAPSLPPADSGELPKGNGRLP